MKLPLKILIHSIFWLVFSLFTLVMSSAPKPGRWPSSQAIGPHLLINTVWAATAFYLFYFFFIHYFENRKFVHYLISSLTVSVGLTFLFIPLHRLFFAPFDILDYRILCPPMFGTFILSQCGCLIRGFEDWFANIKLKAELENRNLRNELELLKSQINPHFLFNTLNNIDFLIQKSPADASASLLKLSGMLRYMTYEASHDRVTMHEEVGYVRNYIDLQKLRWRNKDFVHFTVSEITNCPKVAPMLFITFIENAFKYARDQGTSPVIGIRWECSGPNVEFECWNHYNKNGNFSEQPTGLGLENVKRRLALIYPEKHLLSISTDNSIFKVNLKINLG